MKVYCTFHPSSVLEGGFHLESYIREDFSRFARKQLRAPDNKLPSASASVVGFDTEYDSTGKLLTVALADSRRAKAIEIKPGWKDTIRRVLQRSKILVGHSVEGDIDYLVRNGIAKDSWVKGKNVRDSFLLARMADENKGRGGYGLEPLLLSLYNATPWKEETAALLKKTANAADWTPKQRMERCRLDAWATLLLAEKLYPQVRSEIASVHKERLG
jgi:hypothetical protein